MTGVQTCALPIYRAQHAALNRVEDGRSGREELSLSDVFVYAAWSHAMRKRRGADHVAEESGRWA